MGHTVQCESPSFKELLVFQWLGKWGKWLGRNYKGFCCLRKQGIRGWRSFYIFSHFYIQLMYSKDVFPINFNWDLSLLTFETGTDIETGFMSPLLPMFGNWMRKRRSVLNLNLRHVDVLSEITALVWVSERVTRCLMLPMAWELILLDFARFQTIKITDLVPVLQPTFLDMVSHFR